MSSSCSGTRLVFTDMSSDASLVASMAAFKSLRLLSTRLILDQRAWTATSSSVDTVQFRCLFFCISSCSRVLNRLRSSSDDGVDVLLKVFALNRPAFISIQLNEGSSFPSLE